MKKTRDKLVLNRETLRRLTEIVVGGASGPETGIVTPETASEPITDCTSTNAMVSACICAQ